MEGFIAGTISSIMCHPLETINTNLQLQKPIIIKNLYNGIVPGVLSKGIFYGTFFPMYNYFKDQQFGIFSSYMACNIASTIANPLFVLKTRYQINQYESILSIYRTESFRGLYKGLFMTYLKNIEIGIQMPIYEYLKKDYNIIVSSFFSKLIATSITYPLDTIRTIQRSDKDFLTILNICKKKGLYNGYLLYIFRSLPHTLITFWVYEYLKNR